MTKSDTVTRIRNAQLALAAIVAADGLFGGTHAHATVPTGNEGSLSRPVTDWFKGDGGSPMLVEVQTPLGRKMLRPMHTVLRNSVFKCHDDACLEGPSEDPTLGDLLRAWISEESNGTPASREELLDRTLGFSSPYGLGPEFIQQLIDGAAPAEFADLDMLAEATGYPRGTLWSAERKTRAQGPIPNYVERIQEREALTALSSVLGLSDWHEPDEQNVSASVHGASLDNAGFWPLRRTSGDLEVVCGVPDPRPTNPHDEIYVTIHHEGKPAAYVNLATLLSWASHS